MFRNCDSACYCNRNLQLASMELYGLTDLKHVLFSILILVLSASMAINQVSSPSVSQSIISPQSLTILKLHTNATGISACQTNIAMATGTIVKATGTLFGKIRIIVNVTLGENYNSTYTISLTSFYLLVTQKNIVVSNQTNINQNQNPTNQIASVTLFPGIPVIMILSFQPVCVTAGSLARLLYVDGTFNFVFDLP